MGSALTFVVPLRTIVLVHHEGTWVQLSGIALSMFEDFSTSGLYADKMPLRDSHPAFDASCCCQVPLYPLQTSILVSIRKRRNGFSPFRNNDLLCVSRLFHFAFKVRTPNTKLFAQSCGFHYLHKSCTLSFLQLMYSTWLSFIRKRRAAHWDVNACHFHSTAYPLRKISCRELQTERQMSVPDTVGLQAWTTQVPMILLGFLSTENFGTEDLSECIETERGERNLFSYSRRQATKS